MDAGLQKWEIFWVAVGSVGSVLVAILAIWGDQVRSWILRPSAVVEKYSGHSEYARIDTGEPAEVGAQYFHLRVVNRKRSIPVRDTRVVLVAVSKLRANHTHERVTLPAPKTFFWAPSEDSQEPQTITSDSVFDFGRILAQGDSGFRPSVNSYYPDKSLFAKPREAKRYYLRIKGSNFESEDQVFEVNWDGTFSDNEEEMANHISIDKISGVTLGAGHQ